MQQVAYYDVIGGAENAGVENERVECVSWRGRKVKG